MSSYKLLGIHQALKGIGSETRRNLAKSSSVGSVRSSSDSIAESSISTVRTTSFDFS